MGIFAEVRNERLIRELQRELSKDVVLFGIDGFAYFGNLQAIEDCRIAVLVPAMSSRTDFVQIVGPSENVLEVAFTRVDLWAIVGKATAISTDPFSEGRDNTTTCQTTTTSGTSTTTRTETLKRQESHLLIRQLCCSIGNEVAITTLGGFWFEGLLSTVDDELAIVNVPLLTFTAPPIVIDSVVTLLLGVTAPPETLKSPVTFIVGTVELLPAKANVPPVKSHLPPTLKV